MSQYEAISKTREVERCRLKLERGSEAGEAQMGRVKWKQTEANIDGRVWLEAGNGRR